MVVHISFAIHHRSAAFLKRMREDPSAYKQTNEQQFKVRQPQRAARSKRPNTPSDAGYKTAAVDVKWMHTHRSLTPNSLRTLEDRATFLDHFIVLY